MRPIALASLCTASTVVLLFSYHTSTAATLPSASTSTVAAPSVAAGSAPDPAVTTGSATYTGSSVSTRWGPVQVQITVTGGKITAAPAIVSPDGNRRDVEINDRALPVLEQAAIDAQGAGIDSVSGATVTSEGYISSLQSAIDAANL